MTAKRFLNDDDKNELQTGIEAAEKVASDASRVAQDAATIAHEAYSPTNKPTASDVGSVQFFYALSQLGLTQETATIANIFNAMPIYSKAQFTITSGWLNGEYPVDGMGVLRVEKYNASRAVFEQVLKDASYIGFYDSSFRGWKSQFYADGSVPMDSELKFKGGLSGMKTTALAFIRWIKNAAGTDEKGLWLNNADYTNTSSPLQFVHTTYENGAVKSQKKYAIYGEHNVTCGTSDITAGTSALTTGCYYDVYK